MIALEINDSKGFFFQKGMDDTERAELSLF